MRTNAWITLENTLALSWWDYYQWLLSDRSTAEPPLDDFGKAALRRLVDLEFAFQCFKKATILSREWRLLSVYDVTEQQLNAGYAAYGDAETGGDYAVVGFWRWNGGAPIAYIDPSFNWRPAQVIKYMPDECADPLCGSLVPASVVWDVNLIMGQPPRELPAEARLVA